MDKVAPLAGAWIEITSLDVYVIVRLSLLSRERGLKFDEDFEWCDVTSRSSRGSVD